MRKRLFAVAAVAVFLVLLALITRSGCTQFKVTFTHTGLDPTAVGTVLTLNGSSKAYRDLPYVDWFDCGATISYSYSETVSTNITGKAFRLLNVTGLASPFAVTGSVTLTGNYRTQYQVVFDKTGVGNDFTGPIVTVDGLNYNATSLPASFWWDQSTIHSFSFSSPLAVNASMRYVWDSTSGLSSLKNGNLTIASSGSVVGNYSVANRVTFDQLGVGPDFTGSVVEIDKTSYSLSSLPISFDWQSGLVHSFTFHSPLTVDPSVKQYAWTNTSGLSTSQGGSIAGTASGSVIGNYGTQYYLTVSTSPPGITTIPGEGWYNESTSAVLTAPTVTGYQFTQWIVNGVPQGPTVNPITLAMNAAQNATAQYAQVTTYTLTVTATPGGSTNPPPDIYTYPSGTTVQVTALPSPGYVLDNWEFDGNNVSSVINPYTVTMNTNHSLKAVFSPAPPPPSVTISPADSTIAPGESVSFTSVVKGGTAPYTYQWYLDGAPVQGATSESWTFISTSTGLHFVYLEVTDANSDTAYSNNARVDVVSIPVGGYSESFSEHKPFYQLATYTTLISLLTASLIMARRKEK